MALSRSKKGTSIIKRNNVGDFYCLNCLHSFPTKNKHESYEKVCENRDFCDVITPSEDTKILEFNQCQISDQILFVIYVDLECLVEKMNVKIILKIHKQ